jgi:hypothetical protein
MFVSRKKHAERISTFCGKILFLHVQARGTCSYKGALKRVILYRSEEHKYHRFSRNIFLQIKNSVSFNKYIKITFKRQIVTSLGQTGRYATEICVRYTSKGNRNIGTDRTFSSLRPSCCLLLYICSRCQWSHGLRHGSAFTRLLGLRVRFLPGPWVSVSCECCVLSGRVLGVGLITRPEESYRV